MQGMGQVWAIVLEIQGVRQGPLGTSFTDTMYTDYTVAEDAARSFESIRVAACTIQVPAAMDGAQCIVFEKNYRLNTETATDLHRRRGLEKLTQEEKEALGLHKSCPDVKSDEGLSGLPHPGIPEDGGVIQDLKR